MSCQDLFNSACFDGNLKRAKNLLETRPDINISDNDEEPFRNGCSSAKHLEVAKWLLQVKPDINISIRNDCVFDWACYKGDLEVAQWLVEVNPSMNISAYESAFRNACLNGNSEVAKWLLQVKPEINTYNNSYDVMSDFRKEEMIKYMKQFQTGKKKINYVVICIKQNIQPPRKIDVDLTAINDDELVIAAYNNIDCWLQLRDIMLARFNQEIYDYNDIITIFKKHNESGDELEHTEFIKLYNETTPEELITLYFQTKSTTKKSKDFLIGVPVRNKIIPNFLLRAYKEK